MDKATVTFLKREIKKVLPVFVFGLLGVLVLYGYTYMNLRDQWLDGMLKFAYKNYFHIYQVGDLFLSYLVRDEVSLFVILLEVLLVMRVFYLENRAGISDFLRILPVKEWKKTWIKVGVGEAVNAGLCILFGIVGTIVHAILCPGINEINGIMPQGTTDTDSLAILWQYVFILFCVMSAMFLVLFAAQICVHHKVVAFMVGGGVLFAPVFYSIAYPILIEPVMINRGMLVMIPGSIFDFYPGKDYLAMENANAGSITKILVSWLGYTEKISYLLILAAAALVIIALALKFRWNIRESNNSIINSKAVMEFILTGVSLSAALGYVFVFGDITVGSRDPYERFCTWIVIIIVTGILLFVENIVVEVMRRKRKGV